MKQEDKEDVEKYLNLVFKNYDKATPVDKRNYKRYVKTLKRHEKEMRSISKSVSNNTNPFAKNYNAKKLAKASKEFNKTASKVTEYRKKVSELKDKVNDKITVKFNSIEITTKRQYLDRIKDKSGYLEKRFEKKVKRLTTNMIKKEEYEKATSLGKLLSKTSPQGSDWDDKYWQQDDTSQGSSDDVYEDFEDELEEDWYTGDDSSSSGGGGDSGGGDGDNSYDVIVEVESTGLTVNFV